MTVDATDFRSELLPTEHFDRRFRPESVAFWVPLLVETGRIDERTTVLDVGCGTGGFARAIAERTGAAVVGVDGSARFLAHG